MLDVLVVGGGPVGSFLGALLAKSGLSVQVCERRTAPWEHSRAIGIHPPALRAFEAVGLSGAVVNAAVKIRRGVVLGEQGVLGELPLTGAGRDYPFILSLPQLETERLLHERLTELSPGALRRGCEVRGVRDLGTHCEVSVTEQGQGSCLSARFVVAADGWRSAVRTAAGIAFRGAAYPDSYLMGDFPDTTPFGDDAAIFIRSGGVAECFPLPGGLRRWVVHLGQPLTQPSGPPEPASKNPAPQDPAPTDPAPEDLVRLIRERTGLPVPAAECRMLSAFRVQRFQAERMRRGRLLLIGDAAHVVSPIGGQGMTLGWQDALALAPLLTRACQGESVPDHVWDTFGRRRLRSSALATRQAELNMAAGRPARNSLTQPLREALLSGLLRPALHPLLAATFTMRWL